MDLKLLEIEHTLTGPNKEAAFQSYDTLLAALDQRLVQQLDKGLSPEDFASAEKLKEATLVARKLLRLAVKEGGEPHSATSGVFKP